MMSEVLKIATNTINLEISSIQNFRSLLNENFEAAVHQVHNCKGRIVITGVGKSGIIAQKIVATLNSTGTPAIFMHAADAIHGDIGMVQPNDVAIILSKSGESDEVKVLVPIIKNFGNKLIAIVGNVQSYLAKNADIIIDTTVSEEACPNNLAPTSSTVVQMVCGDALAVCLMHLKGFNADDFAKFHPGGNLGKRLYLRVKNLYLQNAKPIVYVETPLKQIIVEISKGRLGIVVIVDADNKVKGVITDGDIRRLLEKEQNFSDIKAFHFLLGNPKTIQENALAVEALEIMNQANITQLVVTNEHNIYLGVIHLHDLLKEGII